MNKIVGIDFGHTKSGANYGASGLLHESIETRVIGNLVIQKLIAKGCKVINCTVDTATSNSASINQRVKNANAQYLDIFVSLHFNDGVETANGTEILTAGAKKLDEAMQVLKNLESIGFRNRGIKTALTSKGDKVGVVHSTKAKAMLIEICFVGNPKDVALYKSNLDNIANAIANGILLNNSTIITNTDTSLGAASKPVRPLNKKDIVICLQDEINKQGLGKLVKDGIFGNKTLNSCPLLRIGSKGNITKAMQEMLLLKGIKLGESGADGVFGSDTEQAVKRFQAYNRLGADGLVGYNTWNKLFN